MLIQNKLCLGDCVEVMRSLDAECVDLVVTDPPYGYSFMGKDWDRAVPSVEVWRECLRVLKHGAFAFVMSSPRADVLSHMIVNLGDAGFRTDFTPIYWAYACLSEDTEVLTKDGWELFRNTNSFKCKEILCYNHETDRYYWQVPYEWHNYKIKDTIIRIKSDFTEQLVTRNHRVATEHKGKLLFQFAEKLEQTISVPYLACLPNLQDSFYNLSSMVEKEENGNWIVLFNQLPTENQHLQVPFSEWQIQASNVRSAKTEAENRYDGFKEQGLERWSDLFQNTWQLCWCKICSLSSRVFRYGSERWLRYGTSAFGCSAFGEASFENGSCASFRPQSSEQQFRQLSVISEQSSAQAQREWKSYKTTLATVSRECYEGLVFCPTVASGCFVARRKGKIFLTGNSGFPKAMNIGKMVDKRNGRQPEQYKELGEYLRAKRGVKPQKEIAQLFPSKTGGLTGCVANWELGLNVPTKEQWLILKRELQLDSRFDVLIEREEAERVSVGKDKDRGKDTRSLFGMGIGQWDLKPIPATEQAKVLDGSYGGFQPKPAVEVILVAMKPLSEKTFVDQALRNGKGVTWLDDARIPFQSDEDYKQALDWTAHKGATTEHHMGRVENNLAPEQIINSEGRFPANLLCGSAFDFNVDALIAAHKVLNGCVPKTINLNSWNTTIKPCQDNPIPNVKSVENSFTDVLAKKLNPNISVAEDAVQNSTSLSNPTLQSDCNKEEAGTKV